MYGRAGSFYYWWHRPTWMRLWPQQLPAPAFPPTKSKNNCQICWACRKFSSSSQRTLRRPQPPCGSYLKRPTDEYHLSNAINELPEKWNRTRRNTNDIREMETKEKERCEEALHVLTQTSWKSRRALKCFLVRDCPFSEFIRSGGGFGMSCQPPFFFFFCCLFTCRAFSKIDKHSKECGWLENGVTMMMRSAANGRGIGMYAARDEVEDTDA